MAFVENILIPIGQSMLYAFMVGGTFFFIYKLFKNLFPDFKWWIKYSLLGKKFDEKKVQYCLDAYGGKLTSIDIKRNLMLAGKRVTALLRTLTMYPV